MRYLWIVTGSITMMLLLVFAITVWPTGNGKLCDDALIRRRQAEQRTPVHSYPNFTAGYADALADIQTYCK